MHVPSLIIYTSLDIVVVGLAWPLIQSVNSMTRSHDVVHPLPLFFAPLMTPKLSLGQKQSRLVMLCLSPLYSPFFHCHLTFNKQPASVMHAGRAWNYWAILVVCFDAECSPLMDDMHRARPPLSLPDTERASNRGQTLPIPTPPILFRNQSLPAFLPSCLTLPLPCLP